MTKKGLIKIEVGHKKLKLKMCSGFMKFVVFNPNPTGVFLGHNSFSRSWRRYSVFIISGIHEKNIPTHFQPFLTRKFEDIVI